MNTMIRRSLTLAALVSSFASFGCAAEGPVGDAASNIDPSAACGLSYVVEGNSCSTIMAGQYTPAGSVCVEVVGSDVVVRYATINGWEMTAAHMWIGQDLADMPHTATGNPKIGNFPYNSGDITGATSWEFEVPISSINGGICACDMSYLIAAHAALRKADGSGGYETQTGWANGQPINSRGSWATYFGITLGCEEPPPPPPPVEKVCETAFALGETTFIDLGLTDDRWGWEIGAFGPGSYSKPMYAGAAQNDLSKGTLVGNVGYAYDGSKVEVTFSMLAGFTMDETHLYVGATPVNTISPGLFGYTHDLTDASSDSFSVGTFSGEPLFLVAHAVVCH